MAAKKKTPSVPRPEDTTPPVAPPDFSQSSTSQPTTQQQYWNPPARWAIIDGKREYGSHEGLVNASERISRSYYNLNQEPEQLYYSLSPERLNSLITDLRSVGYSVSTQLQAVNAISQLMTQSNAIGYTWDQTLLKMKTSAGRTFDAGRSGYGYKPTNADDLKAVADKVAQQTLGRGFTDAEAQKFVTAYQGMERGGNAPSIDVYAQQFARQQAPKEAAGYKFLDYMNQIFGAYGGTSNV